MDVILAAIITGGFTLIATLVAVYHREILDMFHRKRRDISGVWTGMGRDISIPNLLSYQQSLEYQLSGEVRQRGSHVSVIGKSVSDRTNKIRATGYIRGEYVILKYYNVGKHTDDYGVGILHLLGTGEDMRGFVIGKRMREHGVALIHLQLKRVT